MASEEPAYGALMPRASCRAAAEAPGALSAEADTDEGRRDLSGDADEQRGGGVRASEA